MRADEEELLPTSTTRTHTRLRAPSLPPSTEDAVRVRVGGRLTADIRFFVSE